MNRIGYYVFAIGNIVMGTLNLFWGAFDPDHQPIQAFGNALPGVQIYAYVAGFLLVAGGIGMLFGGRAARFGALGLALTNTIVAIFWLPRLYTAPHYLGLSPSVISGVLGGVGRQLIIVCAATLVYVQFSRKTPQEQDAATAGGRLVFGLSAIDFGVVHLTGVQANVPFVPAWMPFGHETWVVLTGIAFVLAGVAIIAKIFDVLATFLMGLMLLLFSAFTLIPNLTASLHDLGSWGGNAHEFVLVGAVWIFGGWLQRRKVQQVSQLIAARAR